MLKNDMASQPVFSRLFVFFIDFHFEEKNVDFVKNSVFPKENHVFLEFRISWGHAFLNSQTFEKIRFWSQKNAKMDVKIR